MKNISKMEYDSKYMNIVPAAKVVRGDADEVTCPLCEFHGRSLSHHMRKEHGIKGVQLFKDTFPGYAQQTYDVWVKRRVNGETTIKRHGIPFMKSEAKRKSIRLNEVASTGIEITQDTRTGVFSSKTMKNITKKKETPKKKVVPKPRFSSFEEYKGFYENIVDEDFVFCPFCNQGEAVQDDCISAHLRDVHHLTINEARKILPRTAVVGYKRYVIQALGGVSQMKIFGQSVLTEGKWNSKLFHDVHSAHASKLFTELHKDPAFNKKLHGPKSGNLREFYSEVLKKYVYLRSSFELHVLEALESNNIKYVYEYGPILYTMSDGSEHNYFPDFYLPDYNLVIEVKPSTYLKKEEVQTKGEAVRKQGYKFIIIDETIEWSSERILQTIYATASDSE